MKNIRTALIAACVGALAGAAHAGPMYMFDFNGMGYNSSASPATAGVLGYMRGIIPGMTVSGAGELSNNQYTGDSHVVGPGNTRAYVSATLGSTDHGVENGATLHALSTSQPDDFIVNSGSDRITMIFPFALQSVSFDYEIFADGTCPSYQTCTPSNTSWPDFTFRAGNSAGTMTTIFHTVAAAAGTPDMYGHTLYSHSPISGLNTELAPQFLGVSGLVTFSTPVTRLEFVDWPRMIGIDNLQVQAAPEPGTLALLGAGVAILVGMGRRKTSA